MDKIRSFDEVSGILKIDSGAILQTTDEFLASKGYIFPLFATPHHSEHRAWAEC